MASHRDSDVGQGLRSANTRRLRRWSSQVNREPGDWQSSNPLMAGVRGFVDWV
jgi:hypothetical protein